MFIMKKLLSIFILGFILGAIITSVLLKPGAPENSNIVGKTYSPKDMANAADSFKLELNDYIKINKSDEKLKRAEEILGKVILLFLANIAIHFEPEVIEYFDGPKPKNLSKKPLKIKSQNLPAFKKVKKTNLYYANKTPFNQLPQAFEGKINFLSKQILKEPFEVFSKTKAIVKPKDYEKIAGFFSGDLIFLKGKNKGQVDQVLLESDFGIMDGSLKGSYSISISRDGEEYSRNNGSGTNRQIKLLSWERGEYLLEVSPSSFFQVYSVGDNELLGNFYENNLYLGVVRLIREP